MTDWIHTKLSAMKEYFIALYWTLRSEFEYHKNRRQSDLQASQLLLPPPKE